jgi:hypothetical protein
MVMSKKESVVVARSTNVSAERNCNAPGLANREKRRNMLSAAPMSSGLPGGGAGRLRDFAGL